MSAQPTITFSEYHHILQFYPETTCKIVHKTNNLGDFLVVITRSKSILVIEGNQFSRFLSGKTTPYKRYKTYEIFKMQNDHLGREYPCSTSFTWRSLETCGLISP